jgi:hypothetical protein
MSRNTTHLVHRTLIKSIRSKTRKITLASEISAGDTGTPLLYSKSAGTRLLRVATAITNYRCPMPNPKPFTPFAALALALLSLTGCAGLSASCVSGDCVNGQGAILGIGGWSYAGEFRSGQAQGKGTFTWMNGTRFDGQFDGGRRVGPGTLTRANGFVLHGVWNDV